MAKRQAPKIIDPRTAEGGGEIGPFPFDLFERHALAQGDSWFSIGAIPPTKTSNILEELRLKRATVIVNCARPGAQLHHMTDTTSNAAFVRQLTGTFARKWHAVLISGGGNDLIDAACVKPDAPLARRLLRTSAERPAKPSSPADYVSDAGWQTFTVHLTRVFARLMDLRDGGINRTTPLVWHNYAPMVPRPAGAGANFGPWLHPSLDRFEVPQRDRTAIAAELQDRMRKLVDSLTAARVQSRPDAGAIHVVDSMSAGLKKAEQGTSGRSNDWINEIHPTRGGYEKCAGAWQAVLDPVL